MLLPAVYHNVNLTTQERAAVKCMSGPRFSTRAEYGLRALIDLAAHPQAAPVRAGDLAARQAVPVHYLEQLLSFLRQAGLVRSVRGARGGFALARPAGDITLLEALTALEGDPLLAQCLESTAKANCPKAGACALRAVWEDLTGLLKDRLGSLSLEQVCQEQLRLEREVQPVYYI